MFSAIYAEKSALNEKAMFFGVCPLNKACGEGGGVVRVVQIRRCAMRMKRILAQGVGYYHVISRIAGQQFLMDDDEKDVLMRMMFNVAVFSGVEIMTFALMDNHFHILVKVPNAYAVDDVELVEKMRVLYGDAKTDRLLSQWEAWDRRGLSFKTIDAKAALRRRMFDLSQFCKTLKETYSMSYNFRHNHVGTIWGSRFKSILLSPDYKTLMTVGSYILYRPESRTG